MLHYATFLTISGNHLFHFTPDGGRETKGAENGKTEGHMICAPPLDEPIFF